MTDREKNVLARVSRKQPLCKDDHVEVLALIGEGFMHVTPRFDRTEVCPYVLTEKGQQAMRSQP